jgi:hypothetical protein
LKDEQILGFIKNGQTKFDLLITKQFFQESWLMFMYKLKESISFSSFLGRAMSASDELQRRQELLAMLREFYFIDLHTMFLIRKFYYMTELNQAARKAFSPIATDDSPLSTID